MTERHKENLELIKRVLGSEYLELEIVGLTLKEDFSAHTSRVALELREKSNGQSAFTIEGEGVGLVNALVHAFVARYSPEYQSLTSIEFSGFSVSAQFDTKKERAGSDAMGEVVLVVRNSEGREFRFSDRSRSVATSAARAVLAAIEYFVNAERAYVTVYRALQDARDRDRSDLVSRYTRELAEIVKSTSYAEVIEKIKKEVG